MKKIKTLLITVLIIMVSSCSKDKDTYTISGTMKNGDGAEMYLMEMENSGVKMLDTIKIKDKGSFSATEHLQEESIFILQGPNDYIMLCPKIGEKIKINADFDNMAVTYTITGSEESAKLKVLSDKQTMTRLTLKAMSDQLQMMDISNADSMRQEVAKKYKLLRNNQREFIIGYINNNLGSLTTLVAIYRNMEGRPLIDMNEDFDIYKKVLQGLEKMYPTNKNTENFRNFIKHYEQAENNASIVDKNK